MQDMLKLMVKRSIEPEKLDEDGSIVGAEELN